MSNELLSVNQAFLAMMRFLEGYYQRAGSKAELAVLLSDMQILSDGKPADPAAWGDWLDAVRMALEDAPR